MEEGEGVGRIGSNVDRSKIERGMVVWECCCTIKMLEFQYLLSLKQ